MGMRGVFKSTYTHVVPRPSVYRRLRLVSCGFLGWAIVTAAASIMQDARMDKPDDEEIDYYQPFGDLQDVGAARQEVQRAQVRQEPMGRGMPPAHAVAACSPGDLSGQRPQRFLRRTQLFQSKNQTMKALNAIKEVLRPPPRRIIVTSSLQKDKVDE